MLSVMDNDKESGFEVVIEEIGPQGMLRSPTAKPHQVSAEHSKRGTLFGGWEKKKRLSQMWILPTSDITVVEGDIIDWRRPMK